MPSKRGRGRPRGLGRPRGRPRNKSESSRSEKWQGDSSQPDPPSSQPTESQESQESYDSHLSTASVQSSQNNEGYAVRGIKGVRSFPCEGGMETFYLVDWMPGPDGEEYEQSWQAAARLDCEEFIEEFNASRGEVADNASVEISEDRINPFKREIETEYWCIAEQVVDRALEHSGVTTDRPTANLRIIQMLATLPDALLYAICGSGVQARKAVDPELQAVLAANLEASVDRPCIYEMELVDRNGNPPSLRDTEKLISCARRYMTPSAHESDARLISRIDKAKGRLTQGDIQAQDKNPNWKRYLPRESNPVTLETVLAAMERECSALKAEGYPQDIPLPWSMRDIGYTNSGPRRIKEQVNHRGSNKYMSVFEAIAVSETDWDADYAVKGDVIFLCFDLRQARLAEVLFSLIAGSYKEPGRGCNTVNAGASNRSNEEFNDASQWSAFLRATLETTPYLDDMEREKQRAQDWNRQHAERNPRLLDYRGRRHRIRLILSKRRSQCWLTSGALSENSQDSPEL
ncbi:hypothetical protein LTR95_001624 [Oleoguttula sp. CCFEE 5521]